MVENVQIVYAHQLKVVEKSNFEVVVKKSYFKGNHYLIEAVLNEKIVMFEHHSELETGKEVFLGEIK